ncbi:hypothetical protein [Vibrio maerlii]|uniref:hypothetical protein n=1 Tax=Vibrio maerlii TaxID=2231648 RepID=UPI000E3B9B33|nr:hypothetical protein [Vibrio maerlii]
MINMIKLNERLHNDQEAVKTILNQYMEKNKFAHEDINLLYKNHQWRKLYHLTHHLSYALHLLCENETARYIRKIEHSSKGDNVPYEEDIKLSIMGLIDIKYQIQTQLVTDFKREMYL